MTFIKDPSQNHLIFKSYPQKQLFLSKVLRVVLNFILKNEEMFTREYLIFDFKVNYFNFHLWIYSHRSFLPHYYYQY